MTQPDALHTDAGLARQLLIEQFPDLADQTISAQTAVGTAHLLLRLGESLALRFPLGPDAALQCAKEHRWLKTVATGLPVPAPVPHRMGRPTKHYNAPWSVVPWFEGRALWSEQNADRDALAHDIGRFVAALSARPTDNGPAPGTHNFGRGLPLQQRDEPTRTALRRATDIIPVRALEQIWDRALAATPAPTGTWIHGDLHGGNLIINAGRLGAVIDWGGLGVGDPACDLAFAWYELGANQRAVFREQTGADDEAWTRARGWALSVAAIQLPYYRNRNPDMERLARRTLAAVLEPDA